MKNCASSADKFTEIKKATQPVTAFSWIGAALCNFRLADWAASAQFEPRSFCRAPARSKKARLSAGLYVITF